MRMLLVVFILLALVTSYYWIDRQPEGVVSSSVAAVHSQAQEAESNVVSTSLASRANVSDAQVESIADYVLSAQTIGLFDQLISDSIDRDEQQLLQALYDFLTTAGYSKSSVLMVQDVFARYIEYKKALGTVKSAEHESLFSSEHMEDTLFALDNLRKDYFSEHEIDVLFSEQNEYDQMALERLRIQQDNDLTPAQKQQLLEENIAQLPEETRQAFQPSINIRKLQRIKEESKHLSREQRLARLSAEFGEIAGQRLMSTMDKQTDWNRRVDDVHQGIQSIQQHQDLTDAQKNEQIIQLKNERFTEQEQKRLDVYLRHPKLLKRKAN